MTAFYFLGGVIAVLYIIWWSIKNDNVESQDQQIGLLRMNVPVEPEKPKTPMAYGAEPPPEQTPPEGDEDPSDRQGS